MVRASGRRPGGVGLRRPESWWMPGSSPTRRAAVRRRGPRRCWRSSGDHFRRSGGAAPELEGSWPAATSWAEQQALADAQAAAPLRPGRADRLQLPTIPDPVARQRRCRRRGDHWRSLVRPRAGSRRNSQKDHIALGRSTRHPRLRARCEADVRAPAARDPRDAQLYWAVLRSRRTRSRAA